MSKKLNVAILISITVPKQQLSMYSGIVHDIDRFTIKTSFCLSWRWLFDCDMLHWGFCYI